MKTIVAYYFIIFYSVAVCKPVLPLITDYLGHTLWHQKHINTVHHDNGDNHVHYELVGTQEDKKENYSTNVKSSDPVSVHLASESNTLLPCLLFTTPRPTLRDRGVPFPYIDQLLPPPRA